MRTSFVAAPRANRCGAPADVICAIDAKAGRCFEGRGVPRRKPTRPRPAIRPTTSDPTRVRRPTERGSSRTARDARARTFGTRRRARAADGRSTTLCIEFEDSPQNVFGSRGLPLSDSTAGSGRLVRVARGPIGTSSSGGPNQSGRIRTTFGASSRPSSSLCVRIESTGFCRPFFPTSACSVL